MSLFYKVWLLEVSAISKAFKYNLFKKYILEFIIIENVRLTVMSH